MAPKKTKHCRNIEKMQMLKKGSIWEIEMSDGRVKAKKISRDSLEPKAALPTLQPLLMEDRRSKIDWLSKNVSNDLLKLEILFVIFINC